MRVLIDDGLSLSKKLTGIGHYSLEVIQALESAGVDVNVMQYPDYFSHLPVSLKRLFYLKYFSRKNIEKSYDYVHYTNFYMPPLKHKSKVIVTIHDLSPIIVPETFPYRYRSYAKSSISNSLKFADKIVVVSESISDEVKHYYPQYADKVAVVYNSLRLKRDNSSRPLRKKNIFFLYVGVMEKRKNLALLCKAFGFFNQQFNDVKLVLIGKPGYEFDDIEILIKQNENIIYKNYVSDEELRTSFNDATGFIFPSLYEGFGKPVVEAMSFGLPIICSDIPTNLELNTRHGEKFYLFEKHNVEELVSQMIKLYHNQVGFLSYDNLDYYSEEAFRNDLMAKIYNF